MAKLPFLVEPRLKPIKEIIGTDESGKIEIERRGYLTVAEKSFVQGAMSGENALAELQALAARVARKTKLEAIEVFRMLIGQAEDKNDVLLPFESEMASALSNLLAYQEKNKLVVSACLLINRVDSKLSVEDAMELHPDLVDALMALYEDEDRKCTDALKQAMEDEPKEEGKD